MKRQPRDMDETLKRSFACDATVPTTQIESAWERIVQATGGVPVRATTTESRQHPTGNWQRLAVAAVAIRRAVLGSIALTNRSKAAGTFEMAGGVRSVRFDESLRSTDSAGAMLVLADGSRVEMRSAAVLSLKRVADGIRIQLNEGSILVNAAKQVNGHLSVQTQDLSVSVVGTVFFVSREAAGSRVAVIEGEVHVEQGATETRLRPGQQIATPSSGRKPAEGEFAALPYGVMPPMAFSLRSDVEPLPASSMGLTSPEAIAVEGTSRRAVSLQPRMRSRIGMFRAAPTGFDPTRKPFSSTQKPTMLQRQRKTSCVSCFRICWRIDSSYDSVMKQRRLRDSY